MVGGGGFLTGFEASDFTADCNLGGQPVPEGHDFAPVACSAVGGTGRGMRFRRIRAINFGTLISPIECFVFVLASAHPSGEAQGLYADDCVIEDCVLEQPALNSVYVTTYILLNAGEPPSGPYAGVMAWHRGCAVRNCYVNGEFVDNPAAIVSISPSGSTAIVINPHAASAGGE